MVDTSSNQQKKCTCLLKYVTFSLYAVPQKTVPFGNYDPFTLTVNFLHITENHMKYQILFDSKPR